MKQIIFYMAIVATTLYAGCSSQNEISEEQKTQMISEVKVLLDYYPEAVKQKDLEWFKGFWSNSDNFIYTADGQVIDDYDRFIKSYYEDGLVAVQELYRFDWSNVKAAVINEHTVSYAAAFDWGMINTTGDTVKARGSALYVLEKIDGKWQVVNCGASHSYY